MSTIFRRWLLVMAMAPLSALAGESEGWLFGPADREPASVSPRRAPLTHFEPPGQGWAPPCSAPAIEPNRSVAADSYRLCVAEHLYQHWQSHLWHGKLPPFLHAVGVLRLEIGAQGRLLGIEWLRAPDHAPEVMAKIELMARQSQPYPEPPNGRALYTDTWLWHRSGRFQLDTLSEGQR